MSERPWWGLSETLMGTSFIQNWLAWLSLSSLGPTQLTKDYSLRPWNSIWNAHHCELQEKLPHSMSFDSPLVSTKWGVILMPHLLFHDYQFVYKRIFIKPWKLIFFKTDVSSRKLYYKLMISEKNIWNWKKNIFHSL